MIKKFQFCYSRDDTALMFYFCSRSLDILKILPFLIGSKIYGKINKTKKKKKKVKHNDFLAGSKDIRPHH